jgi:DNA-binding LacI/PurR family transcriptional regulator
MDGPVSGAAGAARRFFAGAGKYVPSAFICTSDAEALHLIQAAGTHLKR